MAADKVTRVVKFKAVDGKTDEGEIELLRQTENRATTAAFLDPDS